jgi:hypothetical protein
MSVETKIIQRDETVVDAYTCDDCKTRFPVESWMDTQEMLRWRTTGGYGSIFGDGAEISLDLCQACVQKRLGDILRIGPSTLEQFAGVEGKAESIPLDRPETHP